MKDRKIPESVIMMAEAFEGAGLSGDMVFVECTCEEMPDRVSGLVLPIERFEPRTMGIDPSTGLVTIYHVLDMIEATLADAGRGDLIDKLDEVIKTAARPTMTKARLFGEILPRMEEDGGCPVVWEIRDDDGESMLLIAKSSHFSEIDGLPDTYVMDALVGFVVKMLLKGAGKVPAGSDLSSMLDSIEREINGKGESGDDQIR